VNVRVASSLDHLLIELDPLPNTLVAASHVYLGGRASISFLTKESLTVRVQEHKDGFNVILAETAKGKGLADALDSIESPLVKRVESLQLGEDLLVQVHTQAGVTEHYDLRSRQSRDDLRDLYVYSVDMVPEDGGVRAVQRARAALAGLRPEDISGCARRFDEVLRESLDPAALSRALAPRGAFTDPYLRAAMKRLGELSPDGRIQMLDGSRFDSAHPLELAAAMSQPAEARGYLALLRGFVRELEPRKFQLETLRGLVAPELGAQSFGERVRKASAAEESCRSHS